MFDNLKTAVRELCFGNASLNGSAAAAEFDKLEFDLAAYKSTVDSIVRSINLTSLENIENLRREIVSTRTDAFVEIHALKNALEELLEKGLDAFIRSGLEVGEYVDGDAVVDPENGERWRPTDEAEELLDEPEHQPPPNGLPVYVRHIGGEFDGQMKEIPRSDMIGELVYFNGQKYKRSKFGRANVKSCFIVEGMTEAEALGRLLEHYRPND